MEIERRMGIMEYGKLFVVPGALVAFLLFTGAPRVPASEQNASTAPIKPTITCTKRSSTTATTASKPNTRGTNWPRLASIAGSRTTSGGTWKDTWRVEHNWDDDHGHN